VYLHFIPNHSSWLNQVECWFSIRGNCRMRSLSGLAYRCIMRKLCHRCPTKSFSLALAHPKIWVCR
jgi:hypothetical protein